MNYYKHHIGDYAKKTGALSLVEHGAYLLMLHAYYGSEEALPTGEDLYRLARAHTKAEKAAVDKVAAKFWTRTPAGLVNGRAIEEMESAAALAQVARENGGKGGRPRKPTGLSNQNQLGLGTESHAVKNQKAIQTPDSRLQDPIKKNLKSEKPLETVSERQQSRSIAARLPGMVKLVDKLTS